MLFIREYVASAHSLMDEAERHGGRTGAALLRLAGEYVRRAADGLAPVAEAANDEGLGDGFSQSAPRAH